MAFAQWISDVLGAIADLADLPDPPSSETITEVRKLIVNVSADYRDPPVVSAWKLPDGVGIELRWDDRSIRIGPDGDLTIFEN